MLDNLEADEIPEKYIIIPEKETDLSGKPISREIQETGNYVDILFSAIRRLQSEVAKMKNAFQYGMYSYTGENTAMSRVVKGISDPDEEPLWAIEEEDLSLVYELIIGGGHGLEPDSAVNIGTEGLLKITGEATWTDLESVVKDATDPKLFCYITTTKPNVNIELISNKNGTKHIDLATLGLPVVDSYNIMVLVSRVSNKELDEPVGENYIYLSVGNADRSQILKEGYINTSFNGLSDYKVDIGDSYYIR
jgi:hypothetical protein